MTPNTRAVRPSSGTTLPVVAGMNRRPWSVAPGSIRQEQRRIGGHLVWVELDDAGVRSVIGLR